ncbi:esterase-like activity of phytase family protein [Rhodoligotrophos ferricapiens]|uniref:esterase-like activity of phytase family protein n=1 Tax=Rhodoligotrophos ferricapiens TaxID=3069264 RepID=UPI00315C5DBE
MRRIAVTTSMILGLASAIVVGQSAWAPAQDIETGPVAIRTRPIEFTLGTPSETYGKLKWRGGLQLSSSDDRFGGFSSIVVTEDGKRLLAVSDDGWWLRMNLSYAASGQLSDISNAEMAPLLNKDGRREKRKFNRDAEALTELTPRGPDGPVAVGFENKVRIEQYEIGKNGLPTRPTAAIPLPEAMRKGPHNAQLESLTRFADGKFKDHLLAISENNVNKQGNIRAWLLGDKKPLTFAFEKLETFAITDAIVLPDQSIITLERDFSRSDRRLRMALRRFPSAGIKEGATLKGEVLLISDWPQTSIDNMEALATYRSPDGEQRLLIMSDDNYNGFLQRTLLLQFALPDELG